ncbi:hypothetical protein E5C33_13600 [Stenotrophomonas maltophilia]|uniref:winged helix-turn-helix domain-containing protein n=1 Tax=Stenotrophomonas maltophilia TaxID=40324 RepID=UPI001076843B|nr:winged helix-turn-helix domain-containing protein [Stenotrophomonas maltophilia]TFZ44672.1 hypothetical protein E5C33_13600 [Stenotrophomonas maltophilia]
MTLPWPPETRVLQIGDLAVDLRYRRLISSDGSVELQQRVFELLLLLMSEPDKLFTRNELFDRLWAGLVVDDANLSQSVWLLRRALGENRREWIRTVAKRGYVFSPPAPVIWHLQTVNTVSPSINHSGSSIPSDSSVLLQAMPTPLTATDPDHGPEEVKAIAPVVSADKSINRQLNSIRSPKFKLWMGLLIAMASLALVVTAVSLWMERGQAPSVVSVALLDVSGEGYDDEWAATLLREWLAWKLGSLPQVRLIDSTELSGDKIRSPQMILFSVSPTNDGKHTLIRARIQNGKHEQRFEARGSRTELPALVDRISNEVMQHLLRDGGGTWPALEVNSVAAKRYQAVAQAYRSEDWMKVISQGREVLAESPRFGLMHLQMTEAQARLDLTTDAMHHMELAIRLLKPVPGETEASLQAMRLELDPRKTQEAEEALSDLRKSYPSYVPYRQRYIELLLRSGRFKDAVALLNTPLSYEQSPLAELQQHLQLADAAYAMNEAALSEYHAKQALSLASKGKGIAAKQGDALLLLGYLKADSAPLEAALFYRQAADRLQIAGNTTRSLYASTMAQISSAIGTNDLLPLKAALEKAREAGAPWLEANLLITLANYASSEAERNQFLKQALDVQRQSGNLSGQGDIEAALAMEDVAQLRLSDAHERAARMQALELEGLSGANVGLALAMVYSVEGKPRRAAEALDAAVRTLPADAGSSNPKRVELACMQSGIWLRLADATHLASAAAMCRTPTDPQGRFWASVADTSILLAKGELEAARLEHQKAVRSAASLQNSAKVRAEPPIAAAYRQLRLGEQSVQLGESGAATEWFSRAKNALGSDVSLNPMLTASLDIGYAEAAASRRQWLVAARYAAHARSKLPPGALGMLDRLDLLDIAAARAKGTDGEALTLARRLYRSAGAREEARIQLLALTQVDATALGLNQEELAQLQQMKKDFPGMSRARPRNQLPPGRNEQGALRAPN